MSNQQWNCITLKLELVYSLRPEQKNASRDLALGSSIDKQTNSYICDDDEVKDDLISLSHNKY